MFSKFKFNESSYVDSSLSTNLTEKQNLRKDFFFTYFCNFRFLINNECINIWFCDKGILYITQCIKNLNLLSIWPYITEDKATQRKWTKQNSQT